MTNLLANMLHVCWVLLFVPEYAINPPKFTITEYMLGIFGNEKNLFEGWGGETLRTGDEVTGKHPDNHHI